MGVLLSKSTYSGIIVSGSEIVCSGFGVPVFPTVAEGVFVRLVRVALIAEGVVVVRLSGCACAVCQIDYIAVGVEEVVFRCICGFADEVDTSQITGGCITLNLCYHIAAVQQERCLLRAYGFTGTDTLCVVGILCRWEIVCQQTDLLVKAVISISFCDRFGFSISRGVDRQGIAVGIVGVGGRRSRVIRGGDQPPDGVVDGGDTGVFSVGGLLLRTVLRSVVYQHTEPTPVFYGAAYCTPKNRYPKKSSSLDRDLIRKVNGDVTWSSMFTE